MTASPSSSADVALALANNQREQWPSSLGENPEYERDDPRSLIADAHRFAWEWFRHPQHHDVRELVAYLNFDYFNWEIEYETRHRNSQGIQPWVLAHILREIEGWRNETALQKFLRENPMLTARMGFSKPPKQSDLWKWRHRRFSTELNEAIREIAAEVTGIARYRDIPCPTQTFRPEPAPPKKKDELMVEKAREVWETAQPYVRKHFELDRGPNTTIPDEAYFAQHAYLGMREDLYAESGATAFLADQSQFDQTPTGSAHRWQIKKLQEAKSRRMLRGANRDMIREARRNGELEGGHIAAIDITKGHPYYGGKLDDYAHAEGSQLLGYKNDHDDRVLYYHQWATIQIVGADIPLVLDAVPLRKEQSARHELVDELLTSALDLVDDIDLLVMDREFGGEQVLQICRNHGVHPFTPLKSNQFAEEADQMREDEVRVRIIEQEAIDDSADTEKLVLVPKTSTWDIDDEEERTEQSEISKDWSEGIRKDAADMLGIDEGEMPEPREQGAASIHSMASRAYALNVDYWSREYPDEIEFVCFRTTHPALSLSELEDLSSVDVIQLAANWVKRYRHRWGIENGYKKFKTFMARTTSMDANYRTFNFVFAILLHNCWRLTDMLVKIAIYGENVRYEPVVTAGTFLAILNRHVWADPPPD